MKSYDLLKESIEFASKQLEAFKATKSLDDVSNNGNYSFISKNY